MITVEQLLARVQDKEMRCVAGFKGLSNPISSFTIVDTPDIVQWLKGGEFVASLGYITSTNPEMQQTLIADLAAKGCAGIGIKMHSYYDEIPREYIAQGNKLGFPVLELPYNMRFSDLAYHIHQNIFRRNMSVMEHTYTVFQNLIKLALSDASVDHMLYDISQAVGNPVILVNKDFEFIAAEIPTENKVPLEAFLCLEAHSPLLPRKQLKTVTAYYEETQYITCSTAVKAEDGGQAMQVSFIAVQSENELWGYLAIPETMQPLGSDSHRILENITSAVGIYFIKNKFMPAIGAGANNFLNLVLLNPNGTRESIRYYCRLFDFDYHKKRVCLQVQLKKGDHLSYERQKSIRTLLESTFAAICRQHEVQPYCLGYENRFLAFLLFADTTLTATVHERVEALARDFLQTLENNGLTAQIGISACSREVTQIPVAYKQAVEIVALGKRVQPQQSLHSLERLKVYYNLSSTLTREELLDLASVLTDLHELDADGSSEYVATLERLIDNKFNISKTAGEMFIHRNSMNYRLGKIRSVLAVDLENPEEVLKIQLGLHAQKLLQTMENGQ